VPSTRSCAARSGWCRSSRNWRVAPVTSGSTRRTDKHAVPQEDRDDRSRRRAARA
jgi:hypothetical protein